MLKATKIEFCWTDDEIWLLYESFNQYRCKCEYEGINYESVRSKHERIQEILIIRKLLKTKVKVVEVMLCLGSMIYPKLFGEDLVL